MILFVVVAGVPATAWETFGTRQGLSSSSVTTVAQDSQGFLWFATQNGLDRWDGYHMTVWQNDPFSSNTLSDNLVQTLTIDGERLWLGTYGGLDSFDPATETFQVYQHNDRDPRSLSSDIVLRILRDSRGRLWVGTLGGLNLLDEATGKFRVLGSSDSDASTLSNATIRALAEDRRGRVWVGTGSSLDLLSDDGASVRRFDALFPGKPGPRGPVMGIFAEPKSDVLWLGVWGEGVVRLDTRTGVSQVFPQKENRIFNLTQGEGGEIHLATWGGGLLVFDTKTQDSVVWRHQSGDPTSLAHDVVYGTFRDQSGILWVPTNGGGVSLLNPRHNLFPSLPVDGKVTTLFRDSRSRLWAGLYNHGVGLLDPQTGMVGSWSHDIVNGIAEDSDHKQWWATNSGLVKFDPETGQLRRWSVESGLPEEVITSVMIDPDGKFWIGTFRHGLQLRFPPGSGGAIQSWLPGSLINFTMRDSAGRLWAGTNSGLARYQPETSSFRVWTHDQNDRSSLGGNSVRSFFQDSRGRLWFATNGGLCLFDETGSKFVTYGRGQGLANLTVLAIQEDRLGTLWVATADGLYRLPPDAARFSRFDSADGLPSSEFYRGALRLDSGELVFGGLQFITVFSPETLSRMESAPSVALTGITVVNQSRLVTDRLRLGWQENSVTFSFSVMEFSNPEHHLYAYKLEGFDSAWIDAGTRNEARYTNLPPGTFTFRFRGSTGNSPWAEGERKVVVEVDSAPWRTWWALLGYLLVLGLVVLLAAKVYLDRRWKQKVVELESLRSQLLEVNRKLDHLSRLDGLTGIPNRRALDAWLDNEWALSLRQRQKIALIMLDIDYFKRYNDNYGHLMGDSCLKTVATLLSESLHRTTDFCARFGGEEFVVILHDTELEGARVVAQRLLEAVDAQRIPHETSSIGSFLTISLGVASLQPGPDSVPNDLLHLADQALYRAKSLGRHQVAVTED